jgi:parallel beta-helix repeat protein
LKYPKALTLTLVLCISSLLFINQSYSQPISGDWVVAGNEVVQNSTITLNGNLIIKSGGNLSLDNVTLLVNSGFVSQYKILAEPNSILSIYNSKISSTNPRYGPVFSLTGTNLVMKGNLLNLTTGNNPIAACSSKGGCFIIAGSDNCVIENNLFSIDAGTGAFESGIILQNCQNAIIKNNTITPKGRVSVDVAIEGSNNTTVTQNNMALSNIVLQGSWNTLIRNNTFGVRPAASPAGGLVITFGCGNNIIEDNSFVADYEYGEPCTAFRFVGSKFPNLFMNNIIRGGKDPAGNLFGFKTGGMISQCNNFVIANNSFIDFPKSADFPEQVTNMMGWPNEVLQIYRSDRNQIINNYIDSTNSGIIMFGSSNNIVNGNQVIDSGQGIGLFYSSNNNVVKNNVLDSNIVNVICSDSQNNTLQLNSFLNSKYQAYNINGTNKWAQNYWSNYFGSNRGDGVGADPYYIPYNGIDNEPLITKPLFTPETVPTLETAPYENVLAQENQINYFPSIQKNTTIANQEIVLNSNIDISPGASLTLENVTIIAAPSKTQPFYAIGVRSGSSLYIYNSKVLAGEKGPAVAFFADYASQFIMKNCELYNCGSTFTQEGAAVAITNTNNIRIENNKFSGTKMPLSIFASSNISILNNTISGSLFGVLMSNCRDSVFAENKLSNIVHSSIYTDYSTNSVIANNTFSGVWGYLGWDSSESNTIVNNKVVDYYSAFPGRLKVDPAIITPSLEASFTCSSTQLLINQAVAFDASSSTPGSGQIISYQWNLGDNTAATGPTISHSYSSLGNYIVSLNVTNSAGIWYITSKALTVQTQISPTPTSTLSHTSTSPALPTQTSLPPETTFGQLLSNSQVAFIVVFIIAFITGATVFWVRRRVNKKNMFAACIDNSR